MEGITIASPVIIFVLDLLLGDPSFLLHPVVIMGRAIRGLEMIFRGWIRKKEPREGRIPFRIQRAELFTGTVLAIILPFGTLIITIVIYYCLSGLFWPGCKAGSILLILLDLFWGFQSIAVKDMLKESRNVYDRLRESTEAARQAVGRIVGRDTERLGKEGIIKAAVESVAESFSDGFAAPMFYYVFGGAPFALCYKSINTMDSMIGYKNEKYLYFGRAAAKLDDLANFIPSRLAALLLILAAYMTGRRNPRVSGKEAYRIWKRDRRNHASPNSAQTEAAMAGALGVQLAGGAWYFGEYYDKPTIGDRKREIEEDDILRANRLYFTASLLTVCFAVLIRLLLYVTVKSLI